MSKILNDTTRNIYLASCLYDCIEDNNIRAVKKLLHENGANPNTVIPDRGITPFHLAIGSGNEHFAEEITTLFVTYKGNPNVRSVEELTPVHIAAAWGRLKVLDILLKCGGDPTLTDEEGKTPLDYAQIENHSNIVDFIRNFLQDFNQETQLDNIKYDITLDKIIIYNGAIVAEYGVSNQDELTLDNFSKNVNSYVSNWCNQHANMMRENNQITTISNKDKTHNHDYITNKTVDKNLNISIVSEEDNNVVKENEYSVIDISSENSIPHKNYSRESGILTIHDSSSDNILDLCVINETNENIQSSSTEYLTCESINSFEKNITNSMMTLDLSDRPNNEILNITSDKSIDILTKTNIPCQLTIVDEKEQSLVNVEEEYKYVDNDEGIVLIEKRILVNPKIDDSKSVSVSSKISSLPSIIDYDTDTLRHELTTRGEPPGPITKTTKRIYLKKLKKLQKYTLLEAPVTSNENNRVYSVELEKTLHNPSWTNDLTSYKALESVVANQFSTPEPSKRWREGLTKASFTYLLLDPRITSNLPVKSADLTEEETWKTFLSAIFYVGKGKRSRPYSHLYQAVNYWKKGQTTHGDSKKINYILDIWQNNFGVVCLHIFQNVIPVEAYTREAAMINALKLDNLCNSKHGDFYGICSTWPERKKRLLGVYLLYRAMLIFLNEGERQLRPDDIGK